MPYLTLHMYVARKGALFACNDNTSNVQITFHWFKISIHVMDNQQN